MAARIADLVAGAYEEYAGRFAALTRRAEHRFLRREWQEGQRDAVARLALYRTAIDALEQLLCAHLGTLDEATWHHAMTAYASRVDGRPDVELAHTFFNSITRRLFQPLGLDPRIEFSEAPTPLWRVREPHGLRRYVHHGSTADLLRAILDDLPFAGALASPAEDAGLAAAALERALAVEGAMLAGATAEVIPSVFYRNKGAYLVGRLRTRRGLVPLVLALLHEPRGIVVDAVLTEPDDISSVFGFTRSYFHVETTEPRTLVAFLSSLMPLKRIDELYTAIGYNKHGKTELYRALMAHLESSGAQFEVAEGERGLVMTVFALPSLNLVFKIIRDRCEFPKNVTRRQVMEKYHLVFVRDRVGRLADAHEFEHLAFRRDRFAPGLLEALLAEAGRTVRVEGDLVILRHLYVERRVVPLNLYLRHAGPDEARRVIVDYGNAIKDLAAANIFTGDMLLKNFGVTRHGRVIFYDYDELCLLTECHFRRMPAPRHEQDEFQAEPWFPVGERDVFPEEFEPFLVLPGELGRTFRAAHGDLLGIDFWREMQARQVAGEVVDFFAYRPERRLRRPASIGT
ncbi:MAG: bifunctional isocitrate dehydrogenase kinase/phosphatase [Gemmatimonadota bacterium]